MIVRFEHISAHTCEAYAGTTLRRVGKISGRVGKSVVIPWIEQNGYHMGNVMNAFRLAVVGECRGPHMFDITEIIGKDETIRRLHTAIEKITPAND